MFSKLFLMMTPFLALFSSLEAPQRRSTLLPKRGVKNTFRVMTFNIRIDDDPKHSWSNRLDCVASMMRFHHADVVGLQEPSKGQVEDLLEHLPEYRVFWGVGLNGGAHHDPIFYRKNRFDLKDAGFFYLSPTPKESGLGWDAKFERGVSWVELQDKITQETFFFFNTHFDYHGKLARDESARLLRKEVHSLTKSAPFIVLGDFNLFPELGGERTYDLLIGSKEGTLAHFIDAQQISVTPHHGPTGTWSGFKEAGQPGIKPDYIFVGPQVEVWAHAILSDTFDGCFPSDHLPVVADISLNHTLFE